MGRGPVYEKSFAFAVRIVRIARAMQHESREFVLSKQLLRSGTAIGALVREAEHAESRADFRHKMNIALKEANETLYWVQLLRETELLSHSVSSELEKGITELIRILVAIVRTTKNVREDHTHYQILTSSIE